MKDKPFSTSSSLSFHCSKLVPREYSPTQVRDELALSSARAVDLFLHILLLLLHCSYLVPREYSLSQVRDELALSSARAVDLFLLILLQIGWSIGKMGQGQTHSHTDRHTGRSTDPAILWMGWVKRIKLQY